MKRTCRCGDDGDAAVFGPCYRCTPKPDQEPREQPWETVLSDGDGDLG